MVFFNAPKNVWGILKNEWQFSFKHLRQSEGFKLFQADGLSGHHYIFFLRQFYYLYRTHSSIFTLAHKQLDQNSLRLAESFFKIIENHLGTEQLLFQDLVSMEDDIVLLHSAHLSPATDALVAYVHHQIQNENILAHLAYILHLEFLKFRYAPTILKNWTHAGISLEALSFLKHFASIETHRHPLIEMYVHSLVRSKQDLGYMIHALKVIGQLYEYSFNETFELAESLRSENSSTEDLPDWIFKSESEIESALRRRDLKIKIRPVRD
jgi:hypothetical protein